MQGGYTVDAHAPGDAQIRHTHAAVPHDGKLLRLGGIVVEILHLLLPAVGNLHDDLPDTGQKRFKQALRPALQRLGQNRMVGVGHAVFGDLPRLVPAHARIVHEYAHQLRNYQRGVGVVDLNDVFFMEVPQGTVHLQMLAGDGLDGGGYKEILLLQAQRFTLIVIVLGIEDLADGISHGALLAGLEVLAPAEQLHVHGLWAAGLPQPQGIDMVGLIAGNLHITGHSQNSCVVLVDHHQLAAVPLGTNGAAKVDLLRLLGPRQQPRAADVLPIVRQLHLLALHDLLLEYAQLVADGVARGRDIQCGHTVQIAGSQAAQAAVAEAGIRLMLKQICRLEAQLLHRLGKGLSQAQVIGVFHEAAAHEKLQGQIMHLPELAGVRILPGGNVPLGHDVPQDHGAGPEHIPIPCLPRGAAAVDAQLLRNGFFQCILSHLCFTSMCR